MKKDMQMLKKNLMLHKFIIILTILLAPIIFSCGKTETNLSKEIKTELTKKPNKSCKLLYTKVTKLSAVNFNVDCFEKGTNYVHAYIVLDESDLSASSANAAGIIDDFFHLKRKKVKLEQIMDRQLKIRGKNIVIVILRIQNVKLDEILLYLHMKKHKNNL